jgi:diadenosine tetraphosphatase ApaH/serine/threonine PP2A family protein phosphatase
VRTAVLSDIHGNLEALQACVAHARRQGVDGWAFLGDFVNYGADPLACLDLVRELAGDAPVAVRGNHDEAALGGLWESMNPVAREALHWTRRHLGDDERDFLAALPYRADLAEALLVHASAHRPGEWEYLAGTTQARQCLHATRSDLVFAGHMHVPMLYHRSSDQVRAFDPPAGIAVPLATSRQWLVVAGSVGQPRDGNCAAAYLLYDSDKREVSSCRVPYDHVEAARKILAAGLPRELAWRLARGI